MAEDREEESASQDGRALRKLKKTCRGKIICCSVTEIPAVGVYSEETWLHTLLIYLATFKHERKFSLRASSCDTDAASSFESSHS